MHTERYWRFGQGGLRRVDKLKSSPFDDSKGFKADRIIYVCVCVLACVSEILLYMFQWVYVGLGLYVLKDSDIIACEELCNLNL